MKAQINEENKARFFALYWLQKVLRIPKEDITSYTLQHPYLSPTFSSDRLGYYLLLKPLSKISDLDAKKLLYDSASKFKRASNARLHIDELRGMGYAMNWHGLTVQEMVEAGWIKLIE